jgi:LDH2 family malate/lactate/ureidoglycolate dehydrogenase
MARSSARGDVLAIARAKQHGTCVRRSRVLTTWAHGHWAEMAVAEGLRLFISSTSSRMPVAPYAGADARWDHPCTIGIPLP